MGLILEIDVSREFFFLNWTDECVSKGTCSDEFGDLREILICQGDEYLKLIFKSHFTSSASTVDI